MGKFMKRHSPLVAPRLLQARALLSALQPVETSQFDNYSRLASTTI